MTIWALADLHLCFGVPSKNDGGFWTFMARLYNKIKTHWLEKISPQDLVLIPGDISWAMTLEEGNSRSSLA